MHQLRKQPSKPRRNILRVKDPQFSVFNSKREVKNVILWQWQKARRMIWLIRSCLLFSVTAQDDIFDLPYTTILCDAMRSSKVWKEHTFFQRPVPGTIKLMAGLFPICGNHNRLIQGSQKRKNGMYYRLFVPVSIRTTAPASRSSSRLGISFSLFANIALRIASLLRLLWAWDQLAHFCLVDDRAETL